MGLGPLLWSLSCLAMTLVQGLLFSPSCRSGHFSMLRCTALRLLLKVLLFSILLILKLNKNGAHDVCNSYSCRVP